MGVRPGIKHLIGVQGLGRETKAKMMEWLEENFDESIGDSLFPLFVDNIHEQDFVRKITGDLTVGEVFEVARNESIDFIGIKPVYHLQEAQLYDHKVIWTMVETGMLDMTSRLIRVPYEDLSEHLKKSKDEIRAELSFKDAIALQRYEGEWGRKYKHSNMDYYDADLALAQAYLATVTGIEITKEQIQRYLLIEWE